MSMRRYRAGHRASCVRSSAHASPSGLAVLLIVVLVLATQACVPRVTDDEPPRATQDAPATADPVDDSRETASVPPAVALLDPARAEQQIAEQRRHLLQGHGLSIAPADAGYYLDVLEAELRQILQDGISSANRQDRSILLHIPGSFAFDSGRARINESAKLLLDRIAEAAARYTETLIIIDSHTDPAGDAGLNLELSKQRAIAVARVFLDHGIHGDRIVAFGHGESGQSGKTGPSAGGDRFARRIDIRLAPVIDERDPGTDG